MTQDNGMDSPESLTSKTDGSLPVSPEGIQQRAQAEIQRTENALKGLRTQIEAQLKNATTPEDREHFQAILTKIDALYDEKAGKATAEAKDMLSRLQENLSPKERALVEKAKGGLIDAAGAAMTQAEAMKPKIESAIGGSAKEIKKDAEAAAEAVKSGDIAQAKKIAGGITERVNEAGEKIREITGMAAFKKILEPISENGIFGIFAALGNLFKFIGDGFKFSEILGGASSKADGIIKNGQGKVDAVITKAEQAVSDMSRFYTDPEFKKSVIEKSLPKLGAEISKEFYGGGNLSEAQMADLKDILVNAHYGQETVTRIRDRIEKEGAIAQTSDIADILREVMFGNAEILWLLMSKGIIPLSRVAIHTIHTAGESYKFNMSVVFQKIGVSVPGITFSSQELADKMEKMSPEMKQFMLVEMYRANGLFASLLGTAAGLSASVVNALFVDTSTKIDGIDMFKKNWRGQYSALIKDFEILESSVLKAAGNTGAIPDEIAVFSKHLRQVVANFEILEQIKTDPSRAKVLADSVKSLGNPSTFKNTFSKIFGTRAGIISEQLESLYHIQQYQIGIAKGDMFARMRGLFGSMEIMKAPRMADKVLLHFPSAEAANTTMKQLAAFGPEFLQSFFRGIPVAGLVIAGVDAAKNTEGTGMIDFLKNATSVLVPIVGPIQMFFDDSTGMKVEYGENGLEVKNLGTGLMAIGLLGVDTAILTAHLAAGKPFSQFMTSRITDVAKFAGDVSRFSLAGYRGATKLVPHMGEAMKVAAKFPKKLKAAVVGLLVLSGGAYAWAKTQNDFEKELIEKGYWDPRKQDVTDAFIAKISTLKDEDKRTIFDALFVDFIENKESNIPASDSQLKDGTYTLIVKKESEVGSLWTICNSYDSVFGQELRKLGIGLNIVSQEAIQAASKKV